MRKGFKTSLVVALFAAKAIAVIVLLAGCTTAPAVRIDKAPAANIGGYKTFGFYEQLPTDRGSTNTSLMSARLKQSTREELERHGYVYTGENPDLKVNFNVRIGDRQELRSYPTTGGIFVRRAGLQDFDIVSYRQGTVSIDLVDNHMKSLVWQGIADRRVADKLLEDPGKAVDTFVHHIFMGFPLSRGN